MKIRVVSQIWFREHGWGNTPAPVYDHPESEFWRENNFISIRHSEETNANCAIPVDGPNILKLQFDDAVEDPEHSLLLFNEQIAGKILDFIRRIDTERLLFINCGAGISRSGAVGEVLNWYFNRYLTNNRTDYDDFIQNNRQILPNPIVRKIMMKVLAE